MNEHVCKRCFLMAVGDHSSGDCISLLRRRVRDLEGENLGLADTVTELRAINVAQTKELKSWTDADVVFSGLNGTPTRAETKGAPMSPWIMSVSGGANGDTVSISGVSGMTYAGRNGGNGGYSVCECLGDYTCTNHLKGKI